MRRARLAAEEADLEARRAAYARVTVVWSRSPTSARPGDAAVVTPDGSLQGWVGGSCAEPVVIREALAALADGVPRLLHLGPPDDLPPAEEGVVVAPVGCASEGSLRVFVEPRLPPAHLVVVGRAPLVEALVAMAGVAGFDARAVERDADQEKPLDLTAEAGAGPESYVVVATMGRYDEDALEAALATGARYVALVASERRAASVFATLRGTGVPDVDLARVRAPAGLDLGDLRHEEIAVAILAQVVQEKAAARQPPAPTDLLEPAPVLDPVCGMTVDPATAADRSEHAGATYWFCARGCRRRFDADPARYLTGAAP